MTREEIITIGERARKRIEERGFGVRPMSDEDRSRYRTRIEELRKLRGASASQVTDVA